MPGPGFTRSDICSIRAVASHVHCTRAARGALGAEGRPLAAGEFLLQPDHDEALGILEAGEHRGCLGEALPQEGPVGGRLGHRLGDCALIWLAAVISVLPGVSISTTT